MDPRLSPIAGGFALLAAILCAGCFSFSGTINNINGGEMAVVSFEGSPLMCDDGPSTILLPGNEFITTRAVSPTEIRIDRYNASMVPVWSTPVILPETSTPFKVSRLISVNEVPVETPIALFRAGKEIVMLSYRYGEDDSLFAVGRTFDLATGAILKTKVLDSLPEQNIIPDNAKRFHAWIGSDTGAVVLFTAGYNPATRKCHYRITSARSDLSAATTRLLDVADYSDIERTQSLLIDRAGDIYIISARHPDLIRIEKYDIATGTLGKPINTAITDGKDGSIRIAGVATMFDDHEHLTILASAMNIGDLMGTSIVKFDMREDRIIATTRNPLTGSQFEKLVGAGEFGNARLHTCLRTADPRARYIMAFEQQMMNETYEEHISYDASGRPRSSGRRPVTYYRCDNIVIVAFDDNGGPAWQTSLRKSSGLGMAPFDYITMSASLTDKGTIQIVYRSGTDLDEMEFNVADGTPAIPAIRRLIAFEGPLPLHLAAFTTWLGGDNMLLMTRLGPLKNWDLMRLRVR